VNEPMKIFETVEDVEIQLSTAERAFLAEELSNSIQEIAVMEREKKAFTQKINFQLKIKEQDVIKISNCLKTNRKIQKKLLTVYYNPVDKLREYVDQQTGEIVKTASALPEDGQMRFA